VGKKNQEKVKVGGLGKNNVVEYRSTRIVREKSPVGG